MHNAAFATLGLNWRYLAFEVAPANLQAAIAGAKAMKFSGLNLTVPHKLLAVEMMDELDESAKTWGAVNTIRFEGRTANRGWLPLAELGEQVPTETRAQGFNTDADAIITAIREDLKMEVKGAKILLLGVGGAGRTAALRFASEGVSELFLVNRTSEKAKEMAEEIRKKFPAVRVAVEYPKTDVDLVVNATSLGLKSGDALPLDASQFSLKQTGAVFDMIYRPAETGLLQAAQKAGCKTANGLGMLLHQGAKAFEIWTGKTAPLELMRQALKETIYGH